MFDDDEDVRTRNRMGDARFARFACSVWIGRDEICICVRLFMILHCDSRAHVMSERASEMLHEDAGGREWVSLSLI